MWLCDSSIGRKVVMSVTGIALILFLTFHASMNVVALFSSEGYNMICEFLGANWYAVIATIGGGTAEIVKDKETGILIPPKDYKALSHEILYLLDNETQRKQLSEAAQKRAIKDFSLESMTRQYISIYTSCSIPQ